MNYSPLTTNMIVHDKHNMLKFLNKQLYLLICMNSVHNGFIVSALLRLCVQSISANERCRADVKLATPARSVLSNGSVQSSVHNGTGVNSGTKPGVLPSHQPVNSVAAPSAVKTQLPTLVVKQLPPSVVTPTSTGTKTLQHNGEALWHVETVDKQNMCSVILLRNACL